MANAHAAHADDHHPEFLAHHFDTPVQQFDAAKLGMWLFLAQEILFFSGLFVAYGIYRTWYPSAFSVGSHLLDWKMGALNTFVLLISSFTAAQAVRYSQLGEKSKTGAMLLLTINRALPVLGIQDFWQQAVVGALIIAAIVLDRLLALRQARRLTVMEDSQA